MKKKFLSILTLCIMILICTIGLVACNGDDTGSVDNRDNQFLSVYNTYVVYAESNGSTPLTYEAWLLSIKGEKGDTGAPGEEGLGIKSVEIDNDGHLIIIYTNDKSSDVGLVRGQNGQDGLSVYEIYKKYHAEYQGTEEQFIEDLINNRLGTIEDENSQGLEFCLKDDGTFAVGIGSAKFLSNIVIPYTYNGKSVTEIFDYGFATNFTTPKMETITIPNTVTKIGKYVFEGCSNLTSIAYTGTIAEWGNMTIGEGENILVHCSDGDTYMQSVNYYGAYYLHHINVTGLTSFTTKTYYPGDKYYYVDKLSKDFISVELNENRTVGINAEGNCFSGEYTITGNTVHVKFPQPVAVFGSASSQLLSSVDVLIDNEYMVAGIERFEYYLSKDTVDPLEDCYHTYYYFQDNKATDVSRVELKNDGTFDIISKQPYVPSFSGIYTKDDDKLSFYLSNEGEPFNFEGNLIDNVLTIKLQYDGVGEVEAVYKWVEDYEKEKELLKVYMSVPYEPFEYEEDGEYKGIDVEIAKAIADYLDLEIEFTNVDYDGILTYVCNGQADLAISGIMISERRKSLVDFVSYYEDKISYVVVKDTDTTFDSLTTQEQMWEKLGTLYSNVAVQCDTQSEYITNDLFSNLQAIGYINIISVYNAVLYNEVDFAIVDRLESVQSYQGLKIIEIPLMVDEYGIAINKNNSALKSAVGEAISKLKTSGELDRIVAKYIHAFSSEWSYDETYHWHACNGEYCDEVKDKAEHNFVNGVCSICGKNAEILYTFSEMGSHLNLYEDGIALNENRQMTWEKEDDLIIIVDSDGYGTSIFVPFKIEQDGKTISPYFAEDKTPLYFTHLSVSERTFANSDWKFLDNGKVVLICYSDGEIRLWCMYDYVKEGNILNVEMLGIKFIINDDGSLSPYNG